MQARFEQQDPRAADRARHIKAHAVKISRHIGGPVVERRPRAGHQRNIVGDIVPVLVPAGRQEIRREESRQCGSFRSRPRHHDGIVTTKPAEIVAIRRRLRERCGCRRVALRPRNRPGKPAGRALLCRFQAGLQEPLLRKLRIVVEDQVVDRIMCFAYCTLPSSVRMAPVECMARLKISRPGQFDCEVVHHDKSTSSAGRPLKSCAETRATLSA